MMSAGALELRDVVARSFQFHRVAYISITQKCPLTCRHCFVESSPLRQEAVNEGQILSWFGGMESPPLDTIIVSGGEPFANPRTLAACLRECRKRDIASVVATSGYWAKSLSAGERFLDRFPPIDFLWFSTDVYHEEFVPLAELRNAAQVARERGIGIGFQLIADDSQDSDFVRRFFAEVDPERAYERSILYVPLGKEGRAADLGGLQQSGGKRSLGAVPDGPCEWLGTPWIHEDGAVCACPNLDVHRRAGHPLNLGNLNEMSFAEISRSANDSLYLQALRTLGPSGIADEVPLEVFGVDLAAFRGATICDLCHAIAAVPGAASKIEGHMRTSGWASRITALRAVAHGELHGHG